MGEDLLLRSERVRDLQAAGHLWGPEKPRCRRRRAIAISATFARNYFGDANPIGEVIATDAGVPLHVSLVFEDLPPNTHLKYDALFSSVGLGDMLGDTDDGKLRRDQLWSLPLGPSPYVVMPPGFKPSDWDRIDREFFAKEHDRSC